MQQLKDLFRSIENLNILVIGDVMIDRYLSGQVSRVSPEAPVPVVHLQKEENRLGGAANVALNIRALGGNPILATVIGSNAAAQTFRSLLPQHQLSDELVVSVPDRQTTVKTRIMAGSQQLLRLDQEGVRELNEKETGLLLRRIEDLLPEKAMHAILFQDYNKGVLTRKVIRRVIELARQRNIPTTVDPKKNHFWAFREVDLFKPNLKEIRDNFPFRLEIKLEDLSRASRYIRKKLSNRYNLITLSEHGIFLDDDGEGRILPTIPRSISDVSGAGDTVISLATMGLAAGWDLLTIATLANLAGGQVCERSGVVPVDREQLIREYAELEKRNKGNE